MEPLPTDDERRRSLRRMRTWATGLLVLAAIVYLLTRDGEGVLGYVNAAAEAGMVGAVADWFAVTALFRHPLGLPIPHTALIQSRKAALGRSLQQFIEASFLTPEIAREQTLAARPAQRAATWLQQPANAARVVREAGPLLGRGLRGLSDADTAALVQHVLLPRLAQERFAPVLGHLLDRVVDDGAHTALVDLALDEIHAWLLENRDTVQRLVRERAPTWTPSWVDDRVVALVQRESIRWARDIRDDPDHRVRGAVDALLRRLAQDLCNDPATQERAEALKQHMLANPGTIDAATTFAKSVRDAVADALGTSEGPLADRATTALTDLGRMLAADPQLRRNLDARAADAVAVLVQRYGAEIARTISRTIDRWDGDDAARRIELLAGRDLQFIRINGTVVGALVGLLIHAVSQLL